MSSKDDMVMKNLSYHENPIFLSLKTHNSSLIIFDTSTGVNSISDLVKCSKLSS